MGEGKGEGVCVGGDGMRKERGKGSGRGRREGGDGKRDGERYGEGEGYMESERGNKKNVEREVIRERQTKHLELLREFSNRLADISCP